MRAGAAPYAEVAEGDYVVLTVTDTGTGMSEAVVQRAVEPFFTTKPPSAGSGLGLSMAYGFAKQSGGHLDIDSAVGVGTTVRLYLPRASDDARRCAAIASHAGSADPGGTETILLVDDNQTLIAVTRRHLARLGLQGGCRRRAGRRRWPSSSPAKRSICCSPTSSCPKA